MTIALVALIAIVALGRGGYEPWATFTLELGAGSLVFVAVVKAFAGTDERERSRERARYRAWKKLPMGIRHPLLSRALRISSLGRWPAGGSTTEVEILLPGGGREDAVDLDPSRETFVLGLPFKRTGLGAPLALLSTWIAVSLVPLSRGALVVLTPTGERLRSEAEALLGAEPSAAPWSLVPFLGGRSLWIWIAVCAIFWIAVSRSRSPRRVSRLGLALLGLGIASGLLGLAGWIGGLHEALGLASESLRARGSFGNPNHYAAFQSMLLLAGLGWIAAFRSRENARPGFAGERWNQGALALIAGLGLLVAALGLVLSLSRSGLTSCLVGGAAFVLLSRGARSTTGPRKPSGARALLALGLAVLGFTVWIGIEPLVGRFAGLEEEWEVEGTRLELWGDSLPAVFDFWRTGSGLSSFRYVGALYRGFGGRTFFSWAHNDYLQLAIELGLPGVLLLLWLVVAVVRAAKRVREDLSVYPGLQQLHAGFAAAVVAVAFHSATDFSLHLPANLALVATLVGAVVAMEPPHRGFRPAQPPAKAGSLRSLPSR